MSPLPPPPIQVWGDMPPVWRRWFQDLYGRAGGANGRVIVIDDDGSSVSALQELEVRLAAAIPERPDVAGLETRIAELEAQIASLAASRIGELTGRIDDLAASQERPRAWASDAVTFTPAWTGLTEAGGGVTKTGSFFTVGDLVLLTATIESAGGTSAATAGATYLALPVPARLAGVATAADVTTLVGLAAGVVTTSSVYVPTWAATADTIVVNATYRRG